MKSKLRRLLPWTSTATAASLLILALIANTASTQPPPFDALRRLTADTLADGFEIFTTAPAAAGGGGGTSFFSKQVPLSPPAANVFYVTISGTGDTHSPTPEDPTVDTSALLLACLFDGASCEPNTGSPINLAPTGWVSVLKEPIGSACNDGGGGGADCHDNGVSFTWCIPLEDAGPGTHSVELKMASGGDSPGGTVFMEQINIFVDANFVRAENRCTDFVPPEEAGAAATTGPHVHGKG